MFAVDKFHILAALLCSELKTLIVINELEVYKLNTIVSFLLCSPKLQLFPITVP